MTTPSEVQIDETGPARLVLSGEIDVNVATQVVASGEHLLAADPDEVIVDLSATTFLDSAGVGALVALCNVANGRSAGRLKMRAGPPNVMRVLQMVGLSDTFDLVP